MSTKTHDELIKEAVGWAKSLGYAVSECHLGTETGVDAVFQNYHGEKVMLEVVTGASFRNLFEKTRIKKALVRLGTYLVPPEILGLVVVGDRIENVKDHGVKCGLPGELFDPPKQKIFPVLTRDFHDLIPVLLVSILGTRSSLLARYSWTV